MSRERAVAARPRRLAAEKRIAGGIYLGFGVRLLAMRMD